MSSRRVFFTASMLCHVCSGFVYAAAASKGPGYTAGYSDNKIYSVDLQTGAYVPILQFPPTSLEDIALLNSKTAYVTDQASYLYVVDLPNQSHTPITYFDLPGDFLSVAVANDTTAYVADIENNYIYSVNLQNGAYSILTQITGSPQLSDIAIANETTAYTVGNSSNKVYVVNLQTGAYSPVATVPGTPGLWGIGLANSTTAYVVGHSDNNVYVVDLVTGASSLVTPTPVGSPGNPELENIGLNGTTAYTVGDNDNNIYVVDLLTGSSYALSMIPGAELVGMALLLQMPTAGLSGNNLNLANYLNDNAPINVIREFALLPGGLAQALESAAPTRNAFMTYASQNAYLATSQVISDHLRQKRFHYRMLTYEEMAAEDFPMDEFLADASDRVYGRSRADDDEPCDAHEPYTAWISPFGEYAREKAQQQTPAFSMSLGGVAVAIEHNAEDANVIGISGAYTYTDVHDDHGEGDANLNQGYLGLYGTLNAAKWYFDLGLWGGYYTSDNERRISFSGVAGRAQSTTHGWQLAPHFEVGYDGFRLQRCGVKRFGVEPFFMNDWVANWEHGFTEHGAGSLNMGQNERFCSLLRSETGLRFHETAQFHCGRLVFREKTSYAYQKAFHTGAITAFLVGSPGSFTVDTLSGAQNLGVVEFAMLFISANSTAPYIDIRYQGEFGSQYQSHQAVVELSKRF